MSSYHCVLCMNLSALFCITCRWCWFVLQANCSAFGAYVMSGLISVLYRCVFVFSVADLNLYKDVSALCACAFLEVMCCFIVRFLSSVTPKQVVECLIGIGVWLLSMC